MHLLFGRGDWGVVPAAWLLVFLRVPSIIRFLVETRFTFRSFVVTGAFLHSILAASVSVPEFHTLPFPAASALREGGGTPSAACDCNCFAGALLDCLVLRVPSIIRIVVDTRCTFRSVVVTVAFWLTRSLDHPDLG